jgi:hypothetical protein
MHEHSTPSNIRPQADPQGPAAGDLHVCGACGSQLVQPVEGAEAIPGVYELVLRCPDCERFHETRASVAAVQRYYEELDRGLAALQREMDEFARVSFEEEIERFVTALEADAILPMDFGPAR